MSNKKLKTIEELIRYCFYNYDGKVRFGFNECWEIEEDENISEELLNKVKNMAGEL